MIKGIGDINAKKLIAYCGGAEAVWNDKQSALQKIPGIGLKNAALLKNRETIELAEKEIEQLNKRGIKCSYFLSPDYPKRLTHCSDGPIILYSKGKIDWNAERMVAFVGTRNATVKGKATCEKLIEELSAYHCTIVSGLAYGIDICAHRAALKYGLPTIGILASGLDQVYPKNHYSVAEKMQENGGIATDYPLGTILFPMQFAERNRIVAGLSEAVVVVESSEKGGSLITADLANGYNRDVFAIPGRIDDPQSVGCNKLIKGHKAALIESGADLAYILNWDLQNEKTSKQVQLFVDLSKEEELVVSILREKNDCTVDELSLEANLPMSKTTSILLNLEFKSIIRSLPGKRYEIV